MAADAVGCSLRAPGGRGMMRSRVRDIEKTDRHPAFERPQTLDCSHDPDRRKSAAPAVRRRNARRRSRAATHAGARRRGERRDGAVRRAGDARPGDRRCAADPLRRQFGPLELPPHMGVKGGARRARIARSCTTSRISRADGDFLPQESLRHASNRANEEFHTRQLLQQPAHEVVAAVGAHRAAGARRHAVRRHARGVRRAAGRTEGTRAAPSPSTISGRRAAAPATT